MKFTKQIKEKIYKIVDDTILEWVQNFPEFGKVEAIEKKGYTVVRRFATFCHYTKRFNWGCQPISSDSLFFILGESHMHTGIRMRFWVELPNELAEKVLILGYLPDLS
jgi:hypothetical protein